MRTRRFIALILVGGLMATSVAPRIDAWQRRYANLPSPLVVSSAPPVFSEDGHINYKAELYVNGAWLDITKRVRAPGGVTGFDISRGRADGQVRVSYGRCGFLLNNRDGLFSNRNPNSIYFGQLGHNTPFRLSVAGNFRFHGEIAEFPQRWDTTGSDVWVTVEAAGVMRRLEQGVKPLRSALYRAISRSDAVLYWPLEDGVNSTQAVAAIGGPAMSVTFASGPGEFPFGADGPPGGGTTVDTTGDGDTVLGLSAPATSPLGSGHKQWMIQSVWRAELTFTPGQSTPIRLDTYDSIAWFPQLSATGTFSVRIFDLAAFTEITTLDSAVNILDSAWHHTAVYVRQAGADLAVKLYLDGVQVASTTLVGRTIGAFKKVALSVGNPDYPRVGHLYLTESASTADGALTVDPTHVDAMSGHAGETAAERMQRLCDENVINFTLVGDSSDTAVVGPQQIDTLLNLLRQAAEADAGILYEPRDALGIAYRTRTDLYNQSGPTLDYSASHLSGELAPIDDDQLLLNDVEAVRIDGSSARYTIDTGPLSTQEPPNGAGVYDESRFWMVYADGQLLDIASERAHIGTWDEARYPTISVNLARAPFRADPSLLNSMVGLDIGSYLAISNPPAWLPPDLIELMEQGYTEYLTAFEWKLTFNTTPYGPYRVFRIEGSDLGRLAPAGQTLNGEHSAGTTSLSVATASGYPLINTDAADFPVDIMVSGERVTVTACSGASSPQTLTVVRAVNGISKVLPSGSPITLATRVGIAR